MREWDRKLESDRLRILIEHGIDVREVELDDLAEAVHWISHGRGKPYL
jgi:hypothetical protein